MICVHPQLPMEKEPTTTSSHDISSEPRPVEADRSAILTINGGSSTIKFALFTAADPPTRLLIGQIERIGRPEAILSANFTGDATEAFRIEAQNHEQAGLSLVQWLEQRIGQTKILAVGHRIVHGGLRLVEHQRVTPELLTELRRA